MTESALSAPRLSVQIRRIDPRVGQDIAWPTYAKSGDAGLDLRACLDEPRCLAPNEVALISTGLAIHLAEPGVVGLVLPRSGLGHQHGLILGNGTGVIDSGYQGELRVSCWNRSTTPYTISMGDRIAQLVIVPIVRVDWQFVEAFAPSERGVGGFGHTGSC